MLVCLLFFWIILSDFFSSFLTSVCDLKEFSDRVFSDWFLLLRMDTVRGKWNKVNSSFYFWKLKLKWWQKPHSFFHFPMRHFLTLNVIFSNYSISSWKFYVQKRLGEVCIKRPLFDSNYWCITGAIRTISWSFCVVAVWVFGADKL